MLKNEIWEILIICLLNKVPILISMNLISWDWGWIDLNKKSMMYCFHPTGPSSAMWDTDIKHWVTLIIIHVNIWKYILDKTDIFMQTNLQVKIGYDWIFHNCFAYQGWKDYPDLHILVKYSTNDDIWVVCLNTPLNFIVLSLLTKWCLECQ